MASDTIDEIINQPDWTGKEFSEWMSNLGLTQRKASELLGHGVRQIRNYMKDETKVIPPYTRMACYYIMIKVATDSKKRGEQLLN